MAVRFNINDDVLIRLLSRGEEQFAKYYRDLKLDPEQYRTAHYDGRLKMPLWEVMQIFGPITYMGPEPAFETEVEFC